jgi:hypothetical protein
MCLQHACAKMWVLKSTCVCVCVLGQWCASDALPVQLVVVGSIFMRPCLCLLHCKVPPQPFAYVLPGLLCLCVL